MLLTSDRRWYQLLKVDLRMQGGGGGAPFTEYLLGHPLQQLLLCHSFPLISQWGLVPGPPESLRLVGPLPGMLLQKRLGPELEMPRHLPQLWFSLHRALCPQHRAESRWPPPRCYEGWWPRLQPPDQEGDLRALALLLSCF